MKTIHLKLVFSGLFYLIFLTSCVKSKLDETLEFAGKNRIELEKTLEYFSVHKPDSLKFKAAIFLIENMITQYSYQSNFYKDFDLNIKNGDHKNNIKIVNLLLNKYQNDFATKIYDCQVITSDYLIENIELAFKVWKEKAWCRKIDFETFCEYILPYKVGNEPIENWRAKVLEEYEKELDNIGPHLTIYNAAFELNKHIKKDFAYMDELSHAPDLGYTLLSKYPMGYCKNSTDYVIYCMRAMGIPSGRDFVKQWANRSNAHSWNFVIDETGKTWSFDGAYTNLDATYIHREYSKKGKVYRYTYKVQDIKNINSTKESIPAFFLNKNYKDVSNQYWNTPKVIIDGPKTDKKEIVYLCVFNNNEWIPVQWSKIRNGKYEFKDVESGVLFMPCLFKQNNFIPFDAPFVMTEDNKIRKIIPKMNESMEIVLYRKYPLNPYQSNAARVVRGVFEGSNNPNFDNSNVLATIEKIADNQLFNEINIDNDMKYKYLRYKGGPNSYGSMAEIMFYSENQILHGKIIGKHTSIEHTPEMVFDNNNLTYYIGPIDSAWVGLDLGQPYKINKIMFAPRNDDNYIKTNDIYELFYHDKTQWVSLGEKKADNTYLKYKNIPKGALLWLKNHTAGKEERIFTYSDNIIEWW